VVGHRRCRVRRRHEHKTKRKSSESVKKQSRRSMRCVSIEIENRPPKTKGFGNHRERESTIIYISHTKKRWNEDQ
jgi:hypothetical protein